MTLRTLVLLAAFGLTACAGVDPLSRSVEPEGLARVAGLSRFEPADPSLRIQPGDTLAGSGCLSPMVEPELGVQVRMIRSASRVADYAVPSGALGVGPDEVLRLDRNTGEPLGEVRR